MLCGFGGGGTDKRARSGKDEDAAICIGSDEDGQD